jgi:hypothetical protein
MKLKSLSVARRGNACCLLLIFGMMTVLSAASTAFAQTTYGGTCLRTTLASRGHIAPSDAVFCDCVDRSLQAAARLRPEQRQAEAKSIIDNMFFDCEFKAQQTRIGR